MHRPHPFLMEQNLKLVYNVTVFGKTDRLARQLLLCYFLRRVKMPPSKFETNPLLHL